MKLKKRLRVVTLEEEYLFSRDVARGSRRKKLEGSDGAIGSFGYDRDPVGNFVSDVGLTGIDNGKDAGEEDGCAEGFVDGGGELEAEGEDPPEEGWDNEGDVEDDGLLHGEPDEAWIIRISRDKRKGEEADERSKAERDQGDDREEGSEGEDEDRREFGEVI